MNQIPTTEWLADADCFVASGFRNLFLGIHKAAQMPRPSLTPDPEDHQLTTKDWVTQVPPSPSRSQAQDTEQSVEEDPYQRTQVMDLTRRNRNVIQDSEAEESHDKPGHRRSNVADNSPNTQHAVTRTIEITKASRRVRSPTLTKSSPPGQELYDSTTAQVDTILEEEDPEDDAIVEELAELLKDLEKNNASVTDKKKKLDILISQGCEGEIEIAVFDLVNIRKCRHSSGSAGQSYKGGMSYAPAPQPPNASPLGSLSRQICPKRQRANPSYKESHIRKSKGKAKLYKSTEHVTASDVEDGAEEHTNRDTRTSPNTSTSDLPFSSDVDLKKIIKGVTAEESACIQAFTDCLPSHQFNWGRALAPSIRNIIFCLNHALPPLKAAGSVKSLEAHVAKLKEVCIHKDMLNFLKTAPNLLQLSIDNQFFTQDCLNWEILEASINHPWAKRGGFYRALHSMACRTDNTLQWTSEPSLKSKLNNSFRTLKQILCDSIDLISYHTEHADINISTTGIHAVPEDMVALSKGIGWLYLQIMVRVQGEEENENKKVHKHGIAWLQRRYLLVIIGLMLIYEGHVYNKKFDDFINNEARTQAEIWNERKDLKDASCLNQLSLNWVNLHPQRALKSAGKSVTNGVAQDLTEDQCKVQATRDASETRSDALRALSLFLLYGTAGLFHVWTNRRDVILHDPSHLINMCSILALRYHNSENRDRNAFYKRAWYFDTASLSALFIMDIYDELAHPGHSRSPCGSEAPQVMLAGKQRFPDLEIDHEDVPDVEDDEEVDQDPQPGSSSE
ncbi:uncharacterized protein MELLADRAFT_62516 [Melampsora larici-populina 98AG31]|uniref:Golgi to ER traffic-protein n=1 Tax=Melampsora larici-populina (strain 98AG31 / pathotype 3-4-7) TaxID=747676 RepID=F4RJ75_MELLP|nr:uncharacterized protein MELLADRAFT_62516 [Melampsora larici-populina 98AG31]EGG07553.1 hypothetical protein MELLADRAFT_62516 [Melampsora larici-populina 98AG31]